MSYCIVILVFLFATLMGSRLTEFSAETGKAVFLTSSNEEGWSDSGIQVHRRERDGRSVPAE
jgi:hypothetical protein